MESADTPCSNGKDVADALNKRLEEADEGRRATQERIDRTCKEVAQKVSELEERLNSEIEEKYTSENNRLQAALNSLQAVPPTRRRKRRPKPFCTETKAELVVKQTYRLRATEAKEECFGAAKAYAVSADTEVDGEWLEHRKPEEVRVSRVWTGRVFLEVAFVTKEEEIVLKKKGLEGAVVHIAQLHKHNKDKDRKTKEEEEEEGKGNCLNCDCGEGQYILQKDGERCFSFAPNFLEAEIQPARGKS